MKQFAMIFPGQGFQNLTNIILLAHRNIVIKKTFDESSEYLQYNLFKLIQNTPITKLYQNEFIESVIITISVAIYRLWNTLQGKIPFIVAGNSLGEYSALVCANVLNLEDTLKLVKFRSELMKKIIKNKKTSMQVIIGLNKEIVANICHNQKKNQIVSPSNFNTENQIIISGDAEAVKRASIACKKAGAKYTFLLPVNVASHCSLMKPAETMLLNRLQNINFKPPIYQILNNVDVKCEWSKEKIIDALVRQMSHPVRWQEIIEFMVSKKVNLILEMGSNGTLSNMYKTNTHFQSIVLNNTKKLL